MTSHKSELGVSITQAERFVIIQGRCVSISFCKPCLHSQRSFTRRRHPLTAASAAEKEVDVDPKVPLISSKETGPLPYPIDTETFEDLMGFKGAAPEVSQIVWLLQRVVHVCPRMELCPKSLTPCLFTMQVEAVNLIYVIQNASTQSHNV